MTQQYSCFMGWTSRMDIISMLAMGLPLRPAFVGMVETGQAVTHELAGQGRDRISAFIDREDVFAQLQKQGVTTGEAKARVHAMTDDEAQMIAGKLDQLPAGGSGIGKILDFIFTIFMVLLLTDIFGLTKVFSFTHSIK
jgi:hypothetical protein